MENSASKRQDILHDPLHQEKLYQSSKAWIEALAERNGLVGKLTVLPNDPERYPYQRLDVGFVEAYRPSQQELDMVDEQTVQTELLERLDQSVVAVIGRDKFERFSRDLSSKDTAPARGLTRGKDVIHGQPGSAMRIVLANLGARNHHVALVGFHPNIISLPIYAAEFIDAAKHSQETRGKPFNLFDLTQQIIMPINKSLGFAEYLGQPVPEFLAQFSNVSLKVPPTASSRLFGIEGDLRKAVNDEAEESFDSHLAMLESLGRSALLISDPTGSTAERLTDEAGNFNGLRFRRVSPGAYEQFELFNFVWPITMWWDKDPKEAVWHIGHPETLGAGTRPSAIVEDLALQTGRLAGVEVYFGKSREPLGRIAVES